MKVTNNKLIKNIHSVILVLSAAIIIFFLIIIFVSGCTGKPLTAGNSVVETVAVNEAIETGGNSIMSNEPISEEGSFIPDVIISPIETPAKIPVEYPMLENRIICIDPGHQSIANYEREPIAPGSSQMKEKMTFGTAGTATKIPEYQLNLEVGLKLKKQLEASNAKVIMTRETNGVDISNVERAIIANKNNSDIVVRIHADGIENPNVKGVSVLFPGKQYIQDNKMLENSRKAAKEILEAIINNTSASNRGVIERNDMTGFNWSERPVILIEMGFMTNPEEDRLMASEEYQDKIVKGIMQGLSEYFETSH